MNTPVSIDSSKARSGFFDLIDKVNKGGKEVIIKKMGIPWVKIIPVKTNEDKFLKYAGFLSKEQGDKMIKMVYEGRKDGSAKKKYLAKW